MRIRLLLLLLLLPFASRSQTTYPYALFEGGAGYFLVTVDHNAGTVSPIGPLISGMTGLIAPNTTVIDVNSNLYVVRAQVGASGHLLGIDLNTGLVVHDHLFPQNVVGLEYNCANDSIYGLYQFGNNYALVKVDVATGNMYTVTPILGLSGYVGSTFSLDVPSQTYHFRGTAGATFMHYTVDLTNGAVTMAPAPNNVIGQRHHCSLDTIFGMYEDTSGVYHFVHVDPATGTETIYQSYPSLNPGFVAETVTLHPQSNEYIFIGFVGANAVFVTIDASTGTLMSTVQTFVYPVGLEDPNCCITPPCNLPDPDFTYVTNELDVTFGDSSVGMNTILWHFGDGDSTAQQHPTHSYALPGTYYVCMTVGNGCGDTTLCDSVTVTCSGPTANFSWMDNQLSVLFEDLSAGADSVMWDFGDGNTSSDTTVQHSYDSAGTYIVCLTAWSMCGTDTYCDTLTVFCPAPSAIFQFSGDLSGMQFTDQSFGWPTAWAWDFGDGSVSSTQNPFHVFPDTGQYLVCLSVWNDCDSSTYCTQINVIVHTEEPSHSGWKLYPNPFTDHIQLSVPEGLLGKPLYYVLHDPMGKAVCSGTVTAQGEWIRLSFGELPAGVYALEMRGEGIVFRKWVEKR